MLKAARMDWAELVNQPRMAEGVSASHTRVPGIIENTSNKVYPYTADVLLSQHLPVNPAVTELGNNVVHCLLQTGTHSPSWRTQSHQHASCNKIAVLLHWAAVDDLRCEVAWRTASSLENGNDKESSSNTLLATGDKEEIHRISLNV